MNESSGDVPAGHMDSDEDFADLPKDGLFDLSQRGHAGEVQRLGEQGPDLA